MQTEKTNGNQSLIRGLTLLELLSNFPNGCPLATLAELAKLNKSTVHRLLQGLISEGFVKGANTAGHYRLTSKCLSLGQKTLASMNILSVAAPHLEALNLQLGETVNFSQWEDDYAILIYKLEPTFGLLKTRAYVGQHQQLYCSAMGKIYLAFADKPHYLKDYWQQNQHIIQPLTCNTITSLTAMQTELAEIRQTGFAFDREENELGVGCVAVPVFNHQGSVRYAISISSSTYRLRQLGQAHILHHLRHCANQISQELGWEDNGEILGKI